MKRQKPWVPVQDLDQVAGGSWAGYRREGFAWGIEKASGYGAMAEVLTGVVGDYGSAVAYPFVRAEDWVPGAEPGPAGSSGRRIAKR